MFKQDLTDLQIKDLLRRAYHLAERSTDPSTKVGAIILHNMDECYGWNHIPPGINIDLTDRTLKYKVIEHAERHAIFNAAKYGIALLNTILVCPWAACCDCARAIALSGISKVICHGDTIDKTPTRWQQDMAIAAQIFAASGVRYTKFYGKIGDCQNLFNGEIWYP